VGSWESAYTTMPTVAAPTAAPSSTNPATEITNANGEVFRWNGTSWYLSGNGYSVRSTPFATAIPLPHNQYTSVANVTAPRT
jgi:hypothetical protein